MRIVLLAAIAAAALLGQVDRAALTGRVTEASGAGIPDVSVEVSSKETGFRRTVKTDAGGAYLITGLPVGKYAARFSRQKLTVLLVEVGFKARRIEDLQLLVGQTRTLDVALELGVFEEGVQREEGGAELDHSKAELGAVIQPYQLENLPLNGRNWASLMLLAPGAVDMGMGNQESILFLGRSREDNNWTLDGIDATGVEKPRQEAALRLVISTEAIAEFRVNSALYTAESGAGQGAQINVVSKSGTNQFHGGAFEYFRNDKLNARRALDAERPPFRLNQYGSSLGGPLAKDRTFFYANYEGLRQRLGQTLVGTVPSAAFAAGVISRSPALASIVSAYPRGLRSTADRRIDDYWAQQVQKWREDSAMLRLDHRFSVNTSGFARYNVDDASISEPLNALRELRTTRFRAANLVLQIQHSFSPNFTFEGRLGMNRSPHTVRMDLGIGLDLSVPGLTMFGTSDCDACEGPFVVHAHTSYSWLQSLALTRGRHTFKAGGEVRRLHLNVGFTGSASASYASLEDFARNRLDNISGLADLPTRGGRRTYYLGYVQDEVRVRRGLTINWGLRYEYYSVPHEVRGRARVFDAGGCRGYCAPGSPFYLPDRNNFDPRVSIAWSPASRGNKTVVRAGFGAYHGPGQNLDAIFPITSSVDHFSLSAQDTPGLSLPLMVIPGGAQGSAPRSLQRDRRDPYSAVWSISVGQEFSKGFVGEARYAGSVGHKLFTPAYLNLIDARTGRRPLEQFGRIDEESNAGNSNFHGLILTARRSLTTGLFWETHYMWSHSIDDNSAGGGEAAPQNANCRQCERASSDFDVRHSMNTNFVYHLPTEGLRLPPLARKLLGHWDLSGTATARTGCAVNVTLARSSSDLPDGNSENQRPDVVPGAGWVPRGGATADHWINASAFAVPATGRWGNAGRNPVRGPVLWETSVALSKRVPLNERVSLQFRAEAFNLLNRSQLGNPAAELSSPSTFGRILTPMNAEVTGASTARQMQFLLRLVF